MPCPKRSRRRTERTRAVRRATSAYSIASRCALNRARWIAFSATGRRIAVELGNVIVVYDSDPVAKCGELHIQKGCDLRCPQTDRSWLSRQRAVTPGIDRRWSRASTRPHRGSRSRHPLKTRWLSRRLRRDCRTRDRPRPSPFYQGTVLDGVKGSLVSLGGVAALDAVSAPCRQPLDEDASIAGIRPEVEELSIESLSELRMAVRYGGGEFLNQVLEYCEGLTASRRTDTPAPIDPSAGNTVVGDRGCRS